jgi:hypothetical protein
VRDHLQAQLVGPVQVLQHDQDRAVVAELGDQVGQVLDQQAAPAVPVASGGGQVPQPGRQQLAEVVPPPCPRRTPELRRRR